MFSLGLQVKHSYQAQVMLAFLQLVTLLAKGKDETKIRLSWFKLHHRGSGIPLDFICEHLLLKAFKILYLWPEGPPIRQE